MSDNVTYKNLKEIADGSGKTVEEILRELSVPRLVDNHRPLV